MEALAKLPMLKFSFKTSPHNGDLSKQLKELIRIQFGEDGDKFNEEIKQFEELRSKACCQTSFDFTGISNVKRYYCQLLFLKNRFSILTEKDEDLLSFTWNDIFRGSNPTTLSDINFELSSVLYNIGALHSFLGAGESRHDSDEMKVSCTHFQCAAWAFHTLPDLYSLEHNYDLSSELLAFLSQICLAQAQECILEKSILDHRKSSIIAKVGGQVVDYYHQAKIHNSSGSEGLISLVGKKLGKEWLYYVDFKIHYYSAISYYYHGLQAEETSQMGDRVSYLEASNESLEKSCQYSKNISSDKHSAVVECLTLLRDIIQGKYEIAKKENEFVYHDKVLSPKDLPPLKGASLVKGIGFDISDHKIAGPDIFARLVPMETHEAASLYSEEKAKIIRSLAAEIEDKDSKVDIFMSSLNLSEIPHPGDHIALSHELIEAAAGLSVKKDAIYNLTQAMAKIASVSTEVEASINEINKILKEEGNQEAEFQKNFGDKRPSSLINNELEREVQKYSEAHSMASESNLTLHKAMELHCGNLKLLSMPLEELVKTIPSMEDLDPESEASIAEVHRIISKVHEMKNQRNSLMNQLRCELQEDDITKKLILYKSKDLQEIFKIELKKYEPNIIHLRANLKAQNNILKALTEANAGYVSTRKIIMELLEARQDKIQSLVSSYSAYEDLLQKAGKGLEFYDKLNSNVTKLLSRVKGVCKVQNEERTAYLVSSETRPKLKDYLKSEENMKYISNAVKPIVPQPGSSPIFRPENPRVEQDVRSNQYNEGLLSQKLDQLRQRDALNRQQYKGVQHGNISPNVTSTPQLFSQNPIESKRSETQPTNMVQNYGALPQHYGVLPSSLYTPGIIRPCPTTNYDGQSQGMTFEKYHQYLGRPSQSQGITTPQSSQGIIQHNNGFQQQYHQNIGIPPPSMYAQGVQQPLKNLTILQYPQGMSTLHFTGEQGTQQPYYQSLGIRPPPQGIVNQHYLQGPGIQQVSQNNGIQQQSHNGGVQQVFHNIASQQQSHNSGVIQASHNSGFQQQFHTIATQQQSHNAVAQQQTHNIAPSQQTHNIAPSQQTHNIAPSQQSHNIAIQQVSHNIAAQQQFHNSGVQQQFHSSGVQQQFHSSGVQQPFNNSGVQQQFRDIPAQQLSQNSGVIQPFQNSGVQQQFHNNGIQHQGRYIPAQLQYHQSQRQEITTPQYTQGNQHQVFVQQQQNPQSLGHQQHSNSLLEAQVYTHNLNSVQQPRPLQYEQNILELQIQSPTIVTSQSSSQVTNPPNPINTIILQPNIHEPSNSSSFTNQQSSISQNPYGVSNSENITSSIAASSTIGIKSRSSNEISSEESEMPYLNSQTKIEKNTNSNSLSNLSQSVTSVDEVNTKNGFLTESSDDNGKESTSRKDSILSCSKEKENQKNKANEELEFLSSLDNLKSESFLQPKRIEVEDKNKNQKADSDEEMSLKRNGVLLTKTKKLEEFVLTFHCDKSPFENIWKEILLEKKKTPRISIAPCYPMKNRSSEVLPFDFNRVELPNTKDDFINASHIKDLSSMSPPIIVTQSPTPGTLSDFWAMIWQEQVEIIVNINPNDASNGIHKYWPEDRKTPLLIGNDYEIILQSSKIEKKNSAVERILTITNKSINTSRVLIHLQAKYQIYTPQSALDLTTFLLSYYGQQKEKSHPIVIHDLYGSDYSGSLILLSSSYLEILYGSLNEEFVPFISRLASKLIHCRKGVLKQKEILKLVFEALLLYSKEKLIQCGLTPMSPSLNSFVMEEGHSEEEPIKKRITKEDFLKPSKGLAPLNPEDPLSQLDPFWSLKLN